MPRWNREPRLQTAILILTFCVVFGVSIFFVQGEVLNIISSTINKLIGGEGAGLRSPSLPAITALITAFISFIGTISTVILAWRADRRSTKESERSAKESDLKLIQMIQQFEELKMKLNDPNSSGQERV